MIRPIKGLLFDVGLHNRVRLCHVSHYLNHDIPFASAVVGDMGPPPDVPSTVGLVCDDTVELLLITLRT